MANENNEAFDDALQLDGKIVAAGTTIATTTPADFAVVRYENGGTLVVERPHLFDFDGDFKDDISFFRPTDGTWYLQRSAAGFFAQQFGATAVLIASADFDGDGKTDISVFRPNGGFWFRMNSSSNQFFAVQFGINGDKPIAPAFQ